MKPKYWVCSNVAFTPLSCFQKNSTIQIVIGSLIEIQYTLLCLGFTPDNLPPQVTGYRKKTQKKKIRNNNGNNNGDGEEEQDFASKRVRRMVGSLATTTTAAVVVDDEDEDEAEEKN